MQLASSACFISRAVGKSHSHGCSSRKTPQLCCAGSSSDQNPAGHLSRELPNSVVWLDEAVSKYPGVIYGQNFVLTTLQRPGRHNNPGLVPVQGANLQHFRRTEPANNLSLALTHMQQQSGTSMVPFGLEGVSITDGSIVVDTYATLVRDAGAAAQQDTAQQCLGIVPYNAGGKDSAEPRLDIDNQWVFETSSSNPRRIKKVKFTCNICRCTTISPVNPHAWESGSIFVKCANSKCGIVHKLKDNLELCHDVDFRPKIPRVSKPPPGLRIPPGLPQNPGQGLTGPIASFDVLCEDP